MVVTAGQSVSPSTAAGGGPAVKVIDDLVLGNFDVVEDGLYYIDRVSGEAGSFTDRPNGETRLRYFDFATTRSATVASDWARAERDARRADGILLACRLVHRRVDPR